MRTAGTLAGLALVAALAGCSGGSDAPDDVSTTEFCAAFNDLFDEVLGADPSDAAATVRAFKQWAADMEEVGAPADLPEDARHGFELFVEQAQGLDENASLEELERLGKGLSASDRAAGEAFNDWTSENCPLDQP